MNVAVTRGRVHAGRLRRRYWARKMRPTLTDYPGDRLHLGSGAHPIPGWLNTDLDADPRMGVMAQVDVTKPLPFPDERFAFVFSEHLIEHISYDAGVALLEECHRVLRRGGVIRTTTPDLQQILALTDDHWYVADSYARYALAAPTAAHVVNNFTRAWGHDRGFVHDRGTLREALTTAGFTEIVECGVGQSPHPELTGLERHWEDTSREVNTFECFTLEATRL
jgi:predicted SAM-dependent methyltransferase